MCPRCEFCISNTSRDAKIGDMHSPEKKHACASAVGKIIVCGLVNDELFKILHYRCNLFPE
jgi:hypothetical protein